MVSLIFVAISQLHRCLLCAFKWCFLNANTRQSEYQNALMHIKCTCTSLKKNNACDNILSFRYLWCVTILYIYIYILKDSYIFHFQPQMSSANCSALHFGHDLAPRRSFSASASSGEPMEFIGAAAAKPGAAVGEGSFFSG